MIQYIIFSARHMRDSSDFYWRNDGLQYCKKPSFRNLPTSDPQWRVMYYTTKSSDGKLFYRTEFAQGTKKSTFTTLLDMECDEKYYWSKFF